MNTVKQSAEQVSCVLWVENSSPRIEFVRSTFSTNTWRKRLKELSKMKWHCLILDGLSGTFIAAHFRLISSTTILEIPESSYPTGWEWLVIAALEASMDGLGNLVDQVRWGRQNHLTGAKSLEEVGSELFESWYWNLSLCVCRIPTWYNGSSGRGGCPWSWPSEEWGDNLEFL